MVFKLVIRLSAKEYDCILESAIMEARGVSKDVIVNITESNILNASEKRVFREAICSGLNY